MKYVADLHIHSKFSRATARDMTLDTLAYWAKIIHPEADLDPVGIYREYVGMRGLDYPEENFFVYPTI